MKKFILGTLIAALSTHAFACSIDGKDGFVPENDLYIDVNAEFTSDIDEAKFNEVIDKVEKVYAPIISAMGAKLDVVRNWKDGTVNAYAQQVGSTWKVSMFGGLARHETITEDGFALVVCHEIGHHIGGAPKKGGGAGGFWTGGGIGSSWASNEGQADIWATSKCLRRVFRGEDNAKVLAEMNVPKTVINTCAEQFTSEVDRLICQRGAMAGMSTAKLFQSLRNSSQAPSFDTPDKKVVSSTDHNHPAFQCRLDTYYQGALCHIDELVDADQNNEEVGFCYTANGDKLGARPLCWFKPARD